MALTSTPNTCASSTRSPMWSLATESSSSAPAPPFTGWCPFHADGGRPNLVVYPRSGRWVCFRGDAIGFVQQIERLSFREATTRLGDDPAPAARDRVQRRAADRPASAKHVDAVLDPTEAAALAAAVELYRNRLLSESRALAYLASRGFGRDVVERAHLGYAAGDELVPYLVWRGASVAAARRLGQPGRGRTGASDWTDRVSRDPAGSARLAHRAAARDKGRRSALPRTARPQAAAGLG